MGFHTKTDNSYSSVTSVTPENGQKCDWLLKRNFKVSNPINFATTATKRGHVLSCYDAGDKSMSFLLKLNNLTTLFNILFTHIIQSQPWKLTSENITAETADKNNSACNCCLVSSALNSFSLKCCCHRHDRHCFSAAPSQAAGRRRRQRWGH